MYHRPCSFIRLLHGAPGAPPVDIYANDHLLVSNLAFKNLSSYISVSPGRYRIEVYPAGSRMNPVLTENINVKSNNLYTVAVINTLDNLMLFQIIDMLDITPAGPERNRAYIRAAHLSPNAPVVDIRVDNQTIGTNISYRNSSRYIPLPAATYNLNVFLAGTDNNVLRKENVVLQSGLFYTMYVLGLVNEQPPLQAIVPIDGI